MCCEVLPQYMYVLRAYLTVKTYVLRGVLERQTPRRAGAANELLTSPTTAGSAVQMPSGCAGLERLR